MRRSTDRFRYIRGINYQYNEIIGAIFYAKLDKKDFEDSFYITTPAYYNFRYGLYVLEKEGEVSVYMEKPKGMYEILYTFINLEE